MPMRILALDVGEKKIGVAISDPLGVTAQPLETIKRENKKRDLERINGLVAELNVSRIIVGIPLNMDGTAGFKAKEIYEFVNDLKEDCDVPIQVWDERLSTLEANRILLQADVSRKKRKKLDDKLAAQLILQNYLDSLGREV